MIRVAVYGAAGRMGAHVLEALERAADTTLSAAVDRADHPRQGQALSGGVQLSADVEAALDGSDVVIDFSLPDASLALLQSAQLRKVPLVTATTGFTPDQLAQIRSATRTLPIVMAPNFSLGVYALLELVSRAVQLLPDYEIEVLELHHSAKVDAPSGTALRIAEAAAAARARKLEDVAVYHREGNTGPRDPDAIGIQTLRAGSSAGEHTVFIAGQGERLELTHRAQSRDGFALGAVRAARWVVGKPAGLYGMRDVIES